MNTSEFLSKNLTRVLLIAMLLLLTASLVSCGETEGEPVSYTLGLGTYVDTSASETSRVRATVTVAAVLWDAEGRIAACRFDETSEDMTLSGGHITPPPTNASKAEQGADFTPAVGAEGGAWYAQARSLEEYVIGKSRDAVTEIPTETREGGAFCTDAVIADRCTMDVTALLEALRRACEDTHAVAFTTGKTVRLGLAMTTDPSDSQDADATGDGVARPYTDLCVAAVDGDGRVLAAVIDSAEPQVVFSVTDQIVRTEYPGTKREQGDDYGMKRAGAIAEWYEQAEAFAGYVLGHNAKQIEAIGLDPSGGREVAADPILYAACTLSISGWKAVLFKAVCTAR